VWPITGSVVVPMPYYVTSTAVSRHGGRGTHRVVRALKRARERKRERANRILLPVPVIANSLDDIIDCGESLLESFKSGYPHYFNGVPTV